jgi:hypothetical protein
VSSTLYTVTLQKALISSVIVFNLADSVQMKLR